jgi:predicted RNA-binding Zn ribbon-like protein
MTMTVQPLPDEPMAIRLLNTAWSGDTGEVDLLDARADLARWLAAVGVAARATEEMRIALRSARDVIAAIAADPEDAAGRQALNALLELGTITRTLGADGEVVRTVTVDESRRPGWMAADDLLDIITNRPGRIRQCAHPRCVLWFLDTSRNASRRWCSMAGCGNRAKAQQHYRRRRHSNT